MMQDLQRNSGSSCGMVQSNFLGTEFTIYDRGMSGVTALSPKGDPACIMLYPISPSRLLMAPTLIELALMHNENGCIRGVAGMLYVKA